MYGSYLTQQLFDTNNFTLEMVLLSYLNVIAFCEAANGLTINLKSYRMKIRSKVQILSPKNKLKLIIFI